MIKRLTSFFSLGFLSVLLISVHGRQGAQLTSTAAAVGTSKGSEYYQNASIMQQRSLPRLAIKTNLLYGLSTTPNLGAELSLSDWLSLNLSAGYNPWTFQGNKKIKHILVQSELRYWILEPLNGHFLGTHLLYTNFNAANLNVFSWLKEHRYQGNGYGLGFSYGYQWILSQCWRLESSVGLGYVYFDYNRYNGRMCGDKLNNGSMHYLGLTKAALSLAYILK